MGSFGSTQLAQLIAVPGKKWLRLANLLPTPAFRNFLKVFPARLRPTEVEVVANPHPLICGGVEDSHKKVKNVRLSGFPFGLYCGLRGQV